MYQPSDLAPGERVLIRDNFIGTNKPTMAKVLVVTDRALICEGNMLQHDVAPWVLDALKEAGISPDVRVCLGYYDQIERAVPSEDVKSEYDPLLALSSFLRPPMKFIFDEAPNPRPPVKLICDD